MKIQQHDYILVSVLSVILITGFSSATVSGNTHYPEQDNLTIGIITSGNSSPFHQELLRGFTEAAEEFSWKTIVYSPDNETSISFQKDAMKRLVEAGVDMISLNTLDPVSLSSEILNANTAGIPVFFHNTLTPVKGLNITEYIGYNQYTGSAEMGSYAVRLLAEKRNEAPETVQGEVFILRGLPGFHADQRTAGFIAGLSQSPGIRVIGEEVGGWEREKSRQIALKALSERSGIDIFYGNSDEMAIGAALAVQEQGKEINKDIFCIGIDGNTPTLEMIQNGTMTATLGVYPDKMGEVIIEQMHKLQKGRQIPLYVETPATVVDKDTVDAYVNRSSWIGSSESSGEGRRYI